MDDQELGTTLEITKMRCSDLVSSKRKVLGGLRELDVFEECSRRECWEKSGRAPLTGRWVEDSKPTGWGARFVVRRYLEPRDDRLPTFAATAALANALLVLAHGAQDSGWETHMADVSTAFLHGELKKCAGQANVNLEPPPEVEAGPKMVWRLTSALCGLRGAPQHDRRPSVMRCGTQGGSRTCWTRACSSGRKRRDGGHYGRPRGRHPDFRRPTLRSGPHGEVEGVLLEVGSSVVGTQLSVFLGRERRRVPTGFVFGVGHSNIEESCEVLGVTGSRTSLG